MITTRFQYQWGRYLWPPWYTYPPRYIYPTRYLPPPPHVQKGPETRDAYPMNMKHTCDTITATSLLLHQQDTCVTDRILKLIRVYLLISILSLVIELGPFENNFFFYIFMKNAKVQIVFFLLNDFTHTLFGS